MRGAMGQRDYFSCLMKQSAIPKMFTFRDWAEFTPEQREQRVLNRNRVPDIARYMVDNEDGYLFSSITASYKCQVDFKPLSPGGDLGMLEMEFEDANFVINDGQHRCAAIAAAVKENPALGEDTISVLLFPYENLGRVQQMFSDLNRFVVKTSRSLDILYDKRDPMSQIVLEMVEKVPVFQGMVDKDAMSLPVASAKLFTLTALYDATHELLGSVDPNDEEFIYPEAVARAVDFWKAVSNSFPDWQRVKKGLLPSKELRQSQISAHSVVLRALGAVGSDLLRDPSNNWKSVLHGLEQIDWKKTNPDWENVCIVANSVVSNRQARVATRAYIKEKLGMPLTDVEQRTRIRFDDSEATPPVVQLRLGSE
jgi:DNA sulfur modification protein DndB